jgi:hypothetical protein
MKLTTPLPLSDRDRLYDRAATRLGDSFDPTQIGVKMSYGTLAVKETRDAGGRAWLLDGIATTGSIDQDEEVVVPDGGDWSLFGPQGQYKSLYTDHFYGSSSVVATVREVKRVRGKPDGWRIIAQFMPDDFGEHVKQARMLAERKALGLSIGFQASDRSAPSSDEKAKYPGARSVVRRWKVFEVSTTPMPCNLDCGASALWVDEGKAAVPDGVPEWATKRFNARKSRRVVIVDMAALRG